MDDIKDKNVSEDKKDSSEKMSDAEDKEKKKSKRKKSIKKEEDETKLEEIPETDAVKDKNVSKDKNDSSEKKVSGDMKELEISEADTTQANLEDLKSDVEYVIKIYTLDGDRKSDRVKLTAKTSESYLLVTRQHCVTQHLYIIHVESLITVGSK